MLEVQGVSRHFGPFRAVDDVSFSVEPGTILGLLGPNGAGKTTLIRMIAGTLRPSSGSIIIAGHHMAKEPQQCKLQVGVLFPDGGLAERLTDVENVALFGRLYGLSEVEAVARAKALLTQLGLEPTRRFVETFSKGMRQKVALARALVHDPAVVVLDEPTSGLDVVSAAALEDLVLHLKTEGKAVLLSSHNLSQVEHLCDRVAVLNHGRLAALVDVAQLAADQGRPIAEALLSALKGENLGVAAD